MNWVMRCGDLESENDRLRQAAELALEHVSELRDAWASGAISEHDRLGGTRSSRNVEVETALRKSLDG